MDRGQGRPNGQCDIDEARLADKIRSLALAGKQLELALKALKDESVDTYQMRLTQAREKLWVYITHREACGVFTHDKVYDIYKIPAEVYEHMGPRERQKAG